MECEFDIILVREEVEPTHRRYEPHAVLRYERVEARCIADQDGGASRKGSDARAEN